MAWTGWPPSAGNDIQGYDFIIQLWRACRERYLATKSSSYFNWPRFNTVWASGTITSITSGTLTDSTQDWQENRWYDFDNSNCGLRQNPKFYDVIIDDSDFSDETQIFRAEIVGSPSGDTINIDSKDLVNYETMGWLSSIASLSGKPYRIIKQNGGLYWNERWLEFPNEFELDKGTVDSANHISLTDSSMSWTSNQYQNKELVVYDTNNYLRRLTITSNNETVLSFASGNYVPTGSYSIVEPGSKCDPNRESGRLFWWYGGATDSDESHYPDDSISSTTFPEETVSFQDGDYCLSNCAASNNDALDVDVWAEPDNNCIDGGETCFSPNIYKTLRMLQVELENLCIYYVKEQDYDGSSAIETFVPATFFKEADINWEETSATASGDGGIVFDLDPLPYTPISVYYAVLDSDGVIVDYNGPGEQESISTNKLYKNLGVSASGLTYDCVVSYGWTRKHPREFKYMYDSIVFIPDGNPSPVDPPNVTYPGTWPIRTKSTNYKEHDYLGIVTQNGSGFINNDLARYSGDNWNDPTLYGIDNDFLEYYDNFFEGLRNDSDQATIDSEMIGVITPSGSNRHLTDSTKDWWNLVPQQGTLREETGTATDGGSDFMEDSTKNGNALWDTGTGRWQHFILEMETGAASGQKFPITSSTSAGVVNFEPFGGYTISAGDAYRIREPKYILNRWRGRTVRVTQEDNTTRDVTITHNDDNTLFFEEQDFAASSGLAYQIIERRPGGVWKWEAASSGWIVPTGIDSRGGVAFKSNQNNNLPTCTTKYGRMMKGDYVADHIYNELYDAINVLVWTKHGVDWMSSDVVGSGALNYRTTQNGYIDNPGDYDTTYWGNGGGGAGGANDYGIDKYNSEYLEEVQVNPVNDEDNPMCKFAGDFIPAFTFDNPTDIYAADYARRYAFAILSDINNQFSRKIEFYNYGYIDESDNPSGISDEGAIIYDRSFDSNTDDVLYHLWSKFYEETSQDAQIISDQFGSHDTPNNEEPIPVSGQLTSRVIGYFIGDECAIAKWNTSGGFTYTDHTI